MKFDLFHRLVCGGEKANVDFKLVCNAFNASAGDQEKAKAELVKDICAMANNGSSTSYLIVGVGNDRKTVQSVSDPLLNSQNIQSLVRESIHPRPVVRVHRVRWQEAPSPFAETDFVIIQIGPNARQAFRLARDLINLAKKIHFRRHEVWVRNEDTSDLATPEQIARLLGVRRMAQADPEPSFKVIEYQKLALADQLAALSQDVKTVFGEMGAEFAKPPRPDEAWPGSEWQFRARLRIRGKPFVFRCVFLPRLASGFEKRGLQESWMCEHGTMVFVIGSYTEAGKFKFNRLSVDAKARWGSLGVLAAKKHAWYGHWLPATFAEVSFGILTLSRLTDTKRLREAVGQLFKDIESDDVLFNHLDHARKAMNKELRRWSRKSPIAIASAFPMHSAGRAETFKRHLDSVLNILRSRSTRESGAE